MKDIINKYIKNRCIEVSSGLRVRSIQFIIALSLILITISSMFFVGITLFGKFSKLAEASATVNTRQIINQVNVNLDYYLRSMMEISNYINDKIYQNKDISNDNLKEEMNAILGTRKDIVTISVFSNKGELITGAPSYKVKENINITEQDWFKKPIKEPENLFFSSPHIQNIISDQHNWVVSLSREITLNVDGEMVQGVLLVDMNFSAIDQLCQKTSLGKKGYIYIIDSQGNIVYHPQQQLIYAGLKHENIEDVLNHVFGTYFDNYNGERRLIIIDTVNYCRWRIVGIAYMDEVTVIRENIKTYIKWILLVGVLLVISISYIISAKISHPIKELEKSMKLVEQGNFNINIDVKGDEEVAQLSKNFNLMVSNIRKLTDQIIHEQEAKRISELNALQAQINPHFLYNTLDSVVWMAENGKTEDVIVMITALAKLFRISISKGRNIITVNEEIEHAKNYLIIQKIRYKNKFRFEINVQKETLQYKTLKLILQPIIENSIYHGIEYMVDEGIIEISVSIVDGKLLYEVTDNGLGMSRDVLDNLLLKKAKDDSGSGVGVINVNERIKLHYSNDYGLEIESEQEVGTRVKIWLPLIKD